ncbi:hypothetical protein PR048_021784, partial [Dryococelus australis]
MDQEAMVTYTLGLIFKMLQKNQLNRATYGLSAENVPRQSAPRSCRGPEAKVTGQQGSSHTLEVLSTGPRPNWLPAIIVEVTGPLWYKVIMNDGVSLTNYCQGMSPSGKTLHILADTGSDVAIAPNTVKEGEGHTTQSTRTEVRENVGYGHCLQ